MDMLLDAPWKWGVFLFTAVFTGLAKTGVQGVGSLTIPVYALLFGAKASTGIILPVICLADISAIIYYRRSFRLDYVLKLLPWAVLGIGVAVAAGSLVPGEIFRQLMGVCILMGLIAMLIAKRHAGSSRGFGFLRPLLGMLTGFSALIGNASGPILSVYLLTTDLPKLFFVSTGAWFALFQNTIKLPIQIFVWNNIPAGAWRLMLAAFPFVVFGGYLGTKAVNFLSERNFRTLVLSLTLLSTLMMVVYPYILS